MNSHQTLQQSYFSSHLGHVGKLFGEDVLEPGEVHHILVAAVVLYVAEPDLPRLLLLDQDLITWALK